MALGSGAGLCWNASTSESMPEAITAARLREYRWLRPVPLPSEEETTSKHFKDFYLKAKALTVLHVPYSLDSGPR